MLLSEIKRVAIHEAGHAVVAVHEGFRAPTIRIGAQGADTITPLALPGVSLAAFMRSRLRVLLAGAVVQCLVLCPNETNCLSAALSGAHASEDWQKAREIVLLLIHEKTQGQGGDPAAYDAMVDAIREEVAAEIRQILEANRTTLEQLADLTTAAFDDLEEIGGPMDGSASMYVDLIAVGDVLRGVTKVSWNRA